MNRMKPSAWWGIPLVALSISPAAAIESTPLPERVPRPYLAEEPWAGFYPVIGERDPIFPRDAEAQFARWEALRLALSEPGTRPATEPPNPSLAEGVGTRTGFGSEDVLGRESADFRSAWTMAVARAREGDARGCRVALAGVTPTTLEGERLADRLLFAAAIAEGDRGAADSLYYRLGSGVGPHDGARLDAWHELDDQNYPRAERSLASLDSRSDGEDAALGLARWESRPDAPVSDLPAWSGARGISRGVLALIAARNAALAGDREGARAALDAIPPGSLPTAWEESAGRVRNALGEGGEPAADPSSDAYREAAQRFLGRRDDEARDLLDRWLAQWPDSPLRADAYLLRAQIRLAAGDTDGASGDILAAERMSGSGEIADRALLLRAYLQGQLGGANDALATFDRATRDGLAKQAPGELEFDRSRLLRLIGRTADAEETVLRLEEAFPDEPWAGRGRGDTDAARWREPWRSLPPEPQLAVRIPPPEPGPWSVLLWGDDYLPRTADAVLGTTPSPALAELETPGRTATVPAPPPPAVSEAPMAFIDLGLGIPAAELGGGGVAGIYRGLHYRADLAKTLAQKRNSLPDYRRTDWEGGLAADPGDWKVGVAAEGTARTDGAADRLGLSPDRIDASWWGIRGDMMAGDPDQGGLAASWARVQGEVDARSEGHWKTEQNWYALRGAATLSGVPWTGQTNWGDLTFHSPGLRERKWYRDLRITRGLSGGWYAGVRGALYRKVGLLLPVAGVERTLGGSRWTAWAATEPSLRVPSFRETYVADGDWNVPDLTLDAERRWFDLRGGLRWKGQGGGSLAAGTEIYNTTNLRTWRRDGPLWVETGVRGASGLKLILSGAGQRGRFRVAGKAEAKSVRAQGARVPYVPRYEGWATLDYTVSGWRVGTRLSGVAGRIDEAGAGYGDYLRLDLEGAYRFRAQALFLGIRTMEASLRIQNVTDAPDRRWPGVPAYGIGFLAGVRALYGAGSD